jgi:hypothetical protein
MDVSKDGVLMAGERRCFELTADRFGTLQVSTSAVQMKIALSSTDNKCRPGNNDVITNELPMNDATGDVTEQRHGSRGVCDEHNSSRHVCFLQRPRDTRHSAVSAGCF